MVLPDGVRLTPVNPGGYVGEEGGGSQPARIGQPAEGFVTDIQPNQSSQLDSRGKILPPIPNDELRRELEAAKTAQALADDVVTTSVEVTGQVGAGLNPLIEATERVRAAEEKLNPSLKVARTNLEAGLHKASLADQVDQYRRKTASTGLPQNGPAMSEYVNPEVVAAKAVKKTD